MAKKKKPSKETIIKEMKKAGLPVEQKGIYATLPNIIEDAVDTVNIFGYKYWLGTTAMGVKVQKIVKKLSS